ncbi:uncharacterized protein LOC34619188 [Cyclospora cayetanensis]|uniref:Uncharacterized protein LOC34619188 n=1 Tax=Cyclospora cayetanensis TaxID=88456 RepID=A0A6P6S1A4_9EIME|nr:uncharacterized protein LOC34619188 [Cyclospora cayetanensis]
MHKIGHLTREKRQRLRDIAVGRLYTKASEPLVLRLAAQRAALLTAYGLQLTQHKQETDTQTGLHGVSLQSLTGVNTSYRLEPPLHLLVCLCDCRIQHQQQRQQKLQRRYGNNSSSSRWYVGYATSRQLTATGAARGLRDGLSTFRRCDTSSTGSSDPLQQQQHAVLQHPLYGVSDAACRLLSETQRLLSLKGSGPSLPAAVASLWGFTRKQEKSMPLHASEAAAANSSITNAQQQQEQSVKETAVHDPVAAALAALSREDFCKAQQTAALAIAKDAVIRKNFFVAPQMDAAKNLHFGTASKSKVAKVPAGTAPESSVVATRAAVATAAAASALEDPKTPKRVSQKNIISKEVLAAPASGDTDALKEKTVEKKAPSLWHGDASPLRSPYKKQAQERERMLLATAVFSKFEDLLRAPTNGTLANTSDAALWKAGTMHSDDHVELKGPSGACGCIPLSLARLTCANAAPKVLSKVH